jgi:hypothetical protein
MPNGQEDQSGDQEPEQKNTKQINSQWTLAMRRIPHHVPNFPERPPFISQLKQ